jgi:hypothetical protein
MTLAQVKQAERQMQQQWHDLVMAEQRGEPAETLEHMYNLYILRAEEWNTLTAAYARTSYRSERTARSPQTKSA